MTALRKLVQIKARVSFMDVRQGDESVLPLDAVVQGWIAAGLVDVVDELLVTVDAPEVDSGTDQAGPGSTEPDAAGSEPGGG